MRARRWLAVIGRAASPSETARDNIVAQVRAEVKRPKIKSLEIDLESWVGRHQRTSAGWTDGCVAPLRVATSMRRPRRFAQALRKAMTSSAGAAEEIVQSHAPIESADLFAHAFGSQQVAHPPPRADDTQRYAAARKVEVQLVQHARAREIDMGRRGEAADDQADVARRLRLKTCPYGSEAGVGVDIER